jgi:hypothetical protein
VHQIRSRFLHFLHALLTLDAERSCDRLLRWLKRAALRSKRKSTLRYKMLLDSSASSPSKPPRHYAHTDGGLSAIRCLNQLVDEPPDSRAPAPSSRCLRGSSRSLCCQNFRSPRSCQSRQSSQQPRTFEHRLLLFSPDGARPPHEEFRPLFVSSAKSSAGLPRMFRIDLNSDLLSLTTLGNLKLVVS